MAAHLGPTRPAEMGSVFSALARSRNAVVQSGSSPPQPEAPPAAPAARRDPFVLSKTRRLGPGSGESRAPPAAWEAQPAAWSPEPRAKLVSPELSPVLKRAESASQPHLPRSRSAMGKSPYHARDRGELLPGDLLEEGGASNLPGGETRALSPNRVSFFLSSCS